MDPNDKKQEETPAQAGAPDIPADAIVVTPIAWTDKIVILCNTDLQGRRTYDVGHERIRPPRHPGGKPTSEPMPVQDLLIVLPEGMAYVTVSLKQMARQAAAAAKDEKLLIIPGGQG